MPDPDAGARTRWAKSAARADGLADLGISGAVRRYYAVYFPVVVGGGLGLGFFVAYLLLSEPGTLLMNGLSFGVMLAGLAGTITGFVYGPKRIGPMVQPQRVGVMVGLEAKEVKWVKRQVFGKEPVEGDLKVLRGAAIQEREGLARQLVTFPSLTLSLWGQTLHRGLTSVFDVMFLIVLVVLTVAMGQLVRQFHQTGAFVAATDRWISDGPTLAP